MSVPFVLADADGFYASCERVFHPDLIGRPVVVLSNNDGCVVARSGEAKRLGIANGTPWYRIRERAGRDGVVARSSNYELYASLSARMMRLMERQLPGQEIYSIDECFLRGLADHARTMQRCREIRRSILTGLGIPVTVAVAPTRTLAKVVSHLVKHHGGGVGDWDDMAGRDPRLLEHVPVEEVWGVGRRLTMHLAGIGVTTAAGLAAADPAMIRHRFGVNVQRTALELRGVPAIDLDGFDAVNGARRDQIMCSRMFGRPVTGLADLSAAVSTYTQQAAVRLRRQGSLAGMERVWIATSPYRDDYQARGVTIVLADPCDDPLALCRAASRALPRIIDPHARYVRAGVMLTDLRDAASYQTFEGMQGVRDRGLGPVLDRINDRYGRASVGIGWAGMRGAGRASRETSAPWNTRRDMLSNRGTTRWDEMAVAHAD